MGEEQANRRGQEREQAEKRKPLEEHYEVERWELRIKEVIKKYDQIELEITSIEKADKEIKSVEMRVKIGSGPEWNTRRKFVEFEKLNDRVKEVLPKGKQEQLEEKIKEMKKVAGKDSAASITELMLIAEKNLIETYHACASGNQRIFVEYICERPNVQNGNEDKVEIEEGKRMNTLKGTDQRKLMDLWLDKNYLPSQVEKGRDLMGQNRLANSRDSIVIRRIGSEQDSHKMKCRENLEQGPITPEERYRKSGSYIQTSHKYSEINPEQHTMLQEILKGKNDAQREKDIENVAIRGDREGEKKNEGKGKGEGVSNGKVQRVMDDKVEIGENKELENQTLKQGFYRDKVGRIMRETEEEPELYQYAPLVTTDDLGCSGRVKKKEVVVKSSGIDKVLKSFNKLTRSRAEFKGIFGKELAQAVRETMVRTNYYLPAIVYRCIEYLDHKSAYMEEGIYRISGSSATMEELKNKFETHKDYNILHKSSGYIDIHAVAGLLKLYLRCLPTNLLTAELEPVFYEIVNSQATTRGLKVVKMNELVSALPIENYTLLRALLANLIRIAINKKQTKMNVRNISIVISPSLRIPVLVLTFMMLNYEYLFAIDDNGDRNPKPIDSDGALHDGTDGQDKSIHNINKYDGIQGENASENQIQNQTQTQTQTQTQNENKISDTEITNTNINAASSNNSSCNSSKSYDGDGDGDGDDYDDPNNSDDRVGKMNNFTLHNQNIAGVSGFSDGDNSNTKSNGVYKSKRKSLTDFKDNVGGERSIETTPKSLLKSSYNQNKVERGNRLGVETEM